MKPNREKVTAFLGLLVALFGLWSVAQGFMNPVRGVRVPETTIARSTREVIPKRYRVFTDEAEASRNPFSFSEGWQRMEASTMPAPPVPQLPRPVPLLWPGPAAVEAGFLWQDRPPAERKGEGDE